MMMVALTTPVPLGSCTEPLILPERFWPLSRSAARGTSIARVRIGISNLVFLDGLLRLTDVFNIAANLLSRFVGRAMARAVDQARPEFLSVLARSSSWLA